MANVSNETRPLSPHLQVYRLPLNAKLSILHRITGVALAFAAILIVWYFLALATGPEYFETASAVLTSWFGILVFTLSTVALWLHFANGVRHLVWDTGSHLGQKASNRSAMIGLAFMVVMTIITLWIAIGG
ncbi:succinate dehydrogenase, cytochrome b556 subunit [Maritimibacter dapengensis]|uniref:Succinate dehydrogenase cytochrome b556 subunit n=1 Tax=Maritimibacter dapengensis TaxID=2836868 RepID=A0ABS6SXR8_9RHOB|nr:succinate dehydrogenase, cytochrome b556 subunit [Maritimibacter dapengensis]MBV7377699.1 succinate dehydrogenase, cytochrome b556 subunit [Maritimibacter dapengensis]